MRRIHNKSLGTDKRRAITVISAILSVILCVTLYIFEDYIIGRPTEGEISVHFIDVGQGDAALILTENGSVLIDAGTTESGERVAAYVKTYTDSLDYMILSHPHEDHIGGARDVFESVTVKNVIMPDLTANSAAFDRLLDSIESSDASVHPAYNGESFSLGELYMNILSPAEGEKYEDVNNMSAVVKVSFGKTSFLFTGDAEGPVEQDLLDSGTFLSADVLKVGHHGSSTSSTEKFVKAVSPNIAVISCGKDNSYGHPHAEVVQLLEKLQIDSYRTDKLGDIVIRSDGVTVTVD